MDQPEIGQKVGDASRLPATLLRKLSDRERQSIHKGLWASAEENELVCVNGKVKMSSLRRRRRR